MSIAAKNVIRFVASKNVLSNNSPTVVRSHVARPRSANGSAASPITANTIGLVTVGGSSVGRRNKLHVPHDAAASATMTKPATTGPRGYRGRVSASRAYARVGSYELLAARVPAGARVLDLGCGDGTLCELLERRGCS